MQIGLQTGRSDRQGGIRRRYWLLAYTQVSTATIRIWILGVLGWVYCSRDGGQVAGIAPKIADAMRRWIKTLLIMEVLVCFGPATLFLMLGVVVAPMQVYFLVTMPDEAIPGSLYVVGAVLAGLIGLGALARVLWHLFARTPIRRPVLLGAAIVVALSPLPFFVMNGDTIAYRILAALPFVGTAHILYLSRPLVVKPTAKDLKIAGAWIGALVLIAALGFIADRQRDLSHEELLERQQVWQRSRPSAYEYQLQLSGFLRPEDLWSKRIAVEGNRVISAAYLPSATAPQSFPPATLTAWTMDRVFEELLDAESRHYRVRAVFNERWGYVERASIGTSARESRRELHASDFQPRSSFPPAATRAADDQ